MYNVVEAIRENLRKVIRGKDNVIDMVLAGLFSQGHILLEDIPGVGKTTLAKALAFSINGNFKRIQFTPDLLPADIIGGMVYSPKSGEFSFRPGAVFANVLLTDEINRASPRTQSALLEAMSEQQVTVEGTCHSLPNPFFVIATQNPIEYHGTYPLPEAQLDRFALRLEIGYPSEEEEVRVVLDQRKEHPLVGISHVTSIEEVISICDKVKEIDVEASVVEYMTALVRATREDSRVRLGASTRAALVMYRTCQALAFMDQREFVTPDDVKRMAIPVLAHRIILDTKVSFGDVDKEEIILSILEDLAVPV